MEFFSGLDFFALLMTALVPAAILGLSEKKLNAYRCVLTAIFIYLVYEKHPRQLAYLLIYSAGSIYLVKFFLYFNIKYKKNKFLLWHAIICALAPLIISKWSSAHNGTLFCFLGISYICFRVIQVILEIYDGLITEIHIADYLEFLLFFPVLSSGPIDRSRRFSDDIHNIPTRSEYESLLFDGILKLALGAFYKTVCSALTFRYMNQIFDAVSETHKPVYLIFYAYLYGLYLFFDFAGYSSMAVGVSYVLGIRMPDNFNKPFLSTDLKEFWNRWHITLSWWFRDFVFSRFTMDCIRKKRFRSRTATAAVAFIVNMGIMGMWHGFTPCYVTYGLYHGFLLAATELFQKKTAIYKKYKDNKLFKLCSWFVTLNIVMFGFLIFSGTIEKIWIFAKKGMF